MSLLERLGRKPTPKPAEPAVPEWIKRQRKGLLAKDFTGAGR